MAVAIKGPAAQDQSGPSLRSKLIAKRERNDYDIPRLQFTECLLVLLGGPLVERAGERLMKSCIEGLEALEPNYVALHFVDNQISSLRTQGFAHFSRQRYLSFT